MKALLEQKNGLARRIFSKVGVDNTRLLEATDKSIQRQPKVHSESTSSMLGRDLETLIQRAREYKKEYGDSFVSVEHLVLGFAQDQRFGKQLFKDFQISLQTLKSAIESIRGRQSVIDQDPEGKYEALEKYGKDLTAMAKAGKLDPVIGRDEEIRRCIQILSRRTKNNPVLIGEPGVGKTAISEGLAQRIVEGDVPQALMNRKVHSLCASLSSTHWKLFLSPLHVIRGRAALSITWKSRIQMVKIILFIDEIHTVVGAGATNGAMDAGNLLKPMLGRGELRCIGATTLDEHRKYIEKDPALERRFQQVFVDQPTVEDTISILRGLRERYELHHGVRISDSALVEAAVLSDQYISGRFLPDKAIDLVDEAAAKLKMEITSKPTALDEINRSVLKLEMERLSLMNDTDKASKDRLSRLDTELSLLKKKQAELTEQWEHENAEKELDEYVKSGKSMLREEVTGDDIAEIVSKWTGIPISKLKQIREEKLLHLEDELHKRVVLDDGRTVSFTNTVIIMTSNVGSQYILDTDDNLPKEVANETIKRRVMDAARSVFRPEFMNRVDEYIVFQPLDRDQINSIVGLQLGRVQQRLADRKIKLLVTDAAVEFLGTLGYDPNYGARPVTAFANGHLPQQKLVFKRLETSEDKAAAESRAFSQTVSRSFCKVPWLPNNIFYIPLWLVKLG
ncbi:hypothetical protein D5086_008735 [Populus alba]|uniref:Uncharacterized protein n=1 Tax=Populus alba TaxID=43335 RepID=A0ACC4CGD2_POPAL